MLNIVLVEPEIPQNCGNIARTCAATGAHLHLIKPLGFDISDRAVKRAGLDYWYLVDISVYENLADLLQSIPRRNETAGSPRPRLRRTTARRNSRTAAGSFSERRPRACRSLSAWRTMSAASAFRCARRRAA